MNLSIVIPVHNEADIIPIFHKTAIDSLDSFFNELEFIYVNDCSNDNSLAIIEDLARTDHRITVISFDKRCGKTAALNAGVRRALFNFVVTIDCDLQYHPKDIIKLAKEITDQDVSAVFGLRTKRTTGAVRQISSLIAIKFRNYLLGATYHDCYFAIYKKESFDKIKLYRGFQDFIPVLLELEGLKFKEIPVEEYPRTTGNSKYGVLDRLYKQFVSLLIVKWMAKNHLQHENSAEHSSNEQKSNYLR